MGRLQSQHLGGGGRRIKGSKSAPVKLLSEFGVSLGDLKPDLFFKKPQKPKAIFLKGRGADSSLRGGGGTRLPREPGSGRAGAGDGGDCAGGTIGFLAGQIDTGEVGGGRRLRWASPPTGRHPPGPPPAPHPGRDTRRAEQPITRNPSAGTRRRATRAQGQGQPGRASSPARCSSGNGGVCRPPARPPARKPTRSSSKMILAGISLRMILPKIVSPPGWAT